ncbi:MAG TPA: hypothetical protein VH479_25045, partial [Acidimicrobiales bacterium]
PSDEGRVIWEVTALQPAALDRIVAGQVPPGFTETVGPLADVPTAQVVFTASTEGEGPKSVHGGYVEPQRLEPGTLTRHGRASSLADIRRDARINCSRFPPWQAFPRWVWPVAPVGLVAIAFIGRALGPSRQLPPNPGPDPVGREV